MNILHTIPGRNWGGMEQRTLEQVRWLNSHGHRCWFAAPEDGEPFRRAVALGVEAVPMNFDVPWRPGTIRALRRFVREHAIEVIDTHVTRDAKAAIGCRGLCAVVRSRHTDHTMRSSLLRRLQWRYGADHIITVAGTTRRHLIDIGLADPERATWIGGWADERFFRLADPAAARARIRSELELTPDTFVLLCAAMLRPDKGQDHLLNAVELLLKRGLPVVCLLAGAATDETPAYATQLRERAAALGSAVRFLGYRDDIPDLMQAADVFVLSSLIEGQPRVVVQAFASARPVVAARVGGVSDIVIPGETGWIVPPADPEALSAAIAEVARDPAAAAAMAANAHHLAKTTMRLDLRMAETLRVYRAAIDRSRRRGARIPQPAG